MSEITKELLDSLVKGHNSEPDQVWGRTLRVSHLRGTTEIIGVCSYGNLYFIQLFDDGRVGIDWIRKTDIGKKYKSVMPEHFEVRDNILDKFREKRKAK